MEKKRDLWTVGMMSGTSLDGIDIAAIKTDGYQIFDMSPGLTVPYAPELVRELTSLLGSTQFSPKVAQVELELTHAHARAYGQFLKTAGIQADEVELIGFHGHTLLHQPPSRFETPRTWQLGDGALLAQLTHVDVVYNMRAADVAAGGEGAPLVPLFHQVMFCDVKKPVVVVNIGGVANVTWLGDDNAMLAFDTGPGNALINDWVWEHTRQLYDRDGQLAAVGRVHQEKVKAFLKHPYFTQHPPKSLDRNDFTLEPVRGLSLEDGAATLTEWTAASIAASQEFFPTPPHEWIITGGGRHNITLMHRLRFLLAPARVTTIDTYKWDGNYIEAQAFAFLAMRSRLGLPLTFPTTTGVKEPMSGGVLCSFQPLG